MVGWGKHIEWSVCALWEHRGRNLNLLLHKGNFTKHGQWVDSEVLEFYNRIGQQEHTQSWKPSFTYSLDKHTAASIKFRWN